MIGPVQHSPQTLPTIISEVIYVQVSTSLTYNASFTTAMLSALAQIHSITFVNSGLRHHKVFPALRERT